METKKDFFEELFVGGVAKPEAKTEPAGSVPVLTKDYARTTMVEKSPLGSDSDTDQVRPYFSGKIHGSNAI